VQKNKKKVKFSYYHYILSPTSSQPPNAKIKPSIFDYSILLGTLIFRVARSACGEIFIFVRALDDLSKRK